MDIINIPTHQLKPYEHNAKLHTVKQLQGITESIKRFGFKQPIVIDKHCVIVAGHGRYEAAAALGMKEVPCVVADDLTKEQIREYRLLDNTLAQTGFDYEELKIELEEMKTLGINIENLGLDAKQLGDIFYGKELIAEEDEQNTSTKLIECPNCGHEF